MAYNDFTLEALKRQFDLRTHEGSDLFGEVAPVAISDLLRETLREGVPLALVEMLREAGAPGTAAPSAS